ncbi:MAG: SRPBCC family protein [Acidimicrobiales bacterium]|nr:SRPBCC family protein [Actinomycetota bacterium]
MLSEIDVDVPVRTAYDQWTQFEDFPLFMRHVKEVEQLDDRHVRFKASILGVKREWEAEITEQTPDQRVAWTAVDGTANAGAVTFHPLADERTRVVLQLDLEPEGFVEQVADKGGLADDRAEIDLRSFKDFIERRGRSTGGFRGTIHREADHDHQAARQRYESLGKAEVIGIAHERGIDVSGDATKDDLIDALATDDRRRAEG